MTRRTRTGSGDAKALGGQAQPVLEPDVRLPAEQLARVARIRPRVAEVARARRQIRLLERLAEQPRDRLRELVDRRRRPGGDVEDPAVRALRLGGAEVGRDDVVDVREVAGLLAVVVDRDGLARAMAVMKSGTTAAYCDVGSCRGPKTLK